MGTREDLVSAATALLDDAGLDAVTLRAVGDRAGVSRSAPYRHFDGKAGLLAAVAIADLAAWRVTMEELSARYPDPRERLSAVLESQLAFARAEPHRYRLMFSAEVRAQQTSEMAEVAEDAHAALVEIVAAAAPGADARHLAALLLCTVHGAADLERAGHLDGPKWGTNADGVIAELLTLATP